MSTAIKKSRRVVVTGLGLITPLGLGLKENWENLIAGRTGFKKLTSEEYKSLPCKVAAQIDQDQIQKLVEIGEIVKKSDLKTMSMGNIYSIISAHEALRDSGWQTSEWSDEERTRAGVIIATGMAGVSELAEAAISLYKDPHRGHKNVSPYFIPRLLPNLSSGLVSIRFKLRGPNQCVTTACAAGANAIVDAYENIQQGRADLMVCGATEACVHPISIAGFSRMRALATSFNDHPEKASRPFDRDRDGFVMSEGAGCLVIEALDTYLERMAKKTSKSPKIYAEILGYGLNADANHITNPSPDGDGAFRCMKLALESANIKPNQVDYINTHATSTPAGDLAELTAIKRLFNSDQHSYDKHIYISSLKGSLGHLLGAAGAVETILTIKALQERCIPASINIENLDPDLKLEQTPHLEIVANHTRRIEKSEKRVVAVKNSFGFGGTNVSLCISNFES